MSTFDVEVPGKGAVIRQETKTVRMKNGRSRRTYRYYRVTSRASSHQCLRVMVYMEHITKEGKLKLSDGQRITSGAFLEPLDFVYGRWEHLY